MDMCSVRGMGVAVRVSTSTVLLQLFDGLLVGHAEALFLVHHQQAQILEFHILCQQAMGADDHVDFARLQIGWMTSFCSAAVLKRLKACPPRTGKPWKRFIMVA